MLPDPVFGGDFEQGRHITLANTFDVDRSSLLVGLVVHVRVMLLHGPSLVVRICVDDVVHAFFFSPIDEVLPHCLNVGKNKLSCSAKSQEIMIVVVHFLQVTKASRRDPFLELKENFLHFWRKVP